MLSDSIALTHLVKERRDIIERLVAAYLGHNQRIWDKYCGGAHLGGSAPRGGGDAKPKLLSLVLERNGSVDRFPG